MSQSKSSKFAGCYEQFIKLWNESVDKNPMNFKTQIWFNQALGACMCPTCDWAEIASYCKEYRNLAETFRDLWGEIELMETRYLSHTTNSHK